MLISGSQCAGFKKGCTITTGVFATQDGGENLINVTRMVKGIASGGSTPGIQPELVVHE
jgi:hypothetical protein